MRGPQNQKKTSERNLVTLTWQRRARGHAWSASVGSARGASVTAACSPIEMVMGWGTVHTTYVNTGFGVRGNLNLGF